MRTVSRDLFLLLAALLWTGCGDGPPRALPFPSLDSGAPFPELADGTATAAVQPRRASFADRLRGQSADAGAQEEKVQKVLLGSQLAGSLPADPAWAWQTIEGGTTLAICRAAGSRIAALAYTEEFSVRMWRAPSEEIQRFQLTVNPEGVEGRLTPSAVAGIFAGGLVRQVAARTGTGGPEAARVLQLLTTRTAGTGIGFHPAADSFTGWKWVGKNEQNVTVRLARFKGLWESPPSLPAEIGARLEELGNIPDLRRAVERLGQRNLPSRQEGSGGVSAYLLIGSATDDSEQSGIHLALLWQHSPDHRCVKDLSNFLSSLRTASSEELAPQGAADVLEATGLELLPNSAVVPLDSLRVVRRAG